MKIQLLPSTFDSAGRASLEQRLTCFLIDDCVAVDAGSIALALTDAQHQTLRDIIVTHPHMDHMATLPIFIDDMFALVKEPIRVHATEEVIGLLQRDVFNWTVYPRFSELNNGTCQVMEYVPFRVGEEFTVAHLTVVAAPVNHIVPTVGLIISDKQHTAAFTSDTAATEEFWQLLNRTSNIAAVFIEASFPNSMAQLAEVSGHLTPIGLAAELRKLTHNHFDVLAVHLKPSYRQTLVEELNALGIERLSAMEPGREYKW